MELLGVFRLKLQKIEKTHAIIWVNRENALYGVYMPIITGHKHYIIASPRDYEEILNKGGMNE